MSETTACPTCGDTFESTESTAARTRMRIHHARSHGETLTDETCPECGTDFAPSNSDQTYCSLQCVGRAKRDRVTMACGFCDETFAVPTSRADRRTYCSDDCLYAAQRARGDGPPERTCPVCEESFHAYDGTYCSHECQREARRKRVTFRCDHCDTRVTVPESKADTARYCSRECKNRGQETETPTHTCTACGRTFESYDDDRRFCSHPCAAEHRRTTPRPDDIDAHLYELYVEDDHNMRETWRRLTAARDDHPTKREARERLKDMGVYNTPLADQIRAGEVTIDETETPDGDDSWQAYYTERAND